MIIRLLLLLELSTYLQCECGAAMLVGRTVEAPGVNTQDGL